MDNLMTLELVNEFKDSNGLIRQKNGDSGDQCNRTGFLFFCNALLFDTALPHRVEFSKSLDKLSLSDGTYRRSADPKHWGFSPKTSSRDQQLPIAMALGAWGMKSRLCQMFVKLLSRFGFYTNTRHNWQYETLVEQNEAIKSRIVDRTWEGKHWKLPDFALPHHINCYLRGFNWVVLWPVVLVCDTFLVVNSIVKVIKSRDKNDNDDLQMICMMIQASIYLPTPLSWLAKRIYRLRLNPVYDTWYGRDKPRIPSRVHPAQACLISYFRPESHAPPLDKLCAPLVEKYL